MARDTALSSNTSAAGPGSVASLVLGILGLLTSWALIGIVLAIIAIAIGVRREPKGGLSRVGVVLGWIAIAVGVLFAVLRGVAAVNS